VGYLKYVMPCDGLAMTRYDDVIYVKVVGLTIY
jgi:hypothetical protein